MIKAFFHKVKLIFSDKNLAKKIYFVLGAFVVFRLLASIPIPGVDAFALKNFLDSNQFFGLLNMFSGGGLSGLSIVMLGVGPYITASIIMQVVTMISPKMKSMYSEEGEYGKKKFYQYSRILTIPLALIQGLSFILILQQKNILGDLSTFQMATNLIVITAGSMFLMWLGELVTEFGIGNGMSLIIFAGIVARLPNDLQQIIFSYDPTMLPTYIAFAIVGLVIVTGVVFITEAERPVPVTHAKQAMGVSSQMSKTTYIPLRLNMAGVIPIIFALSILMLPQMIANLFVTSTNATLQSIASHVNAFLTNQLYHGILYFLLVFLLTYFYTSVTFDPDGMSKNLQKSGAFIPGVRPGESTAKHIGHILARITLVGGLFLGLIAVLPLVVQGLTGITTLTIGGTSLLIAVSVAIDLVKKIDSQVSMREY